MKDDGKDKRKKKRGRPKGILTEREKKLIGIITHKIEHNEPIIKRRILREAGYSENTIHNPHQTLNRAIFQRALAKAVPPERMINVVDRLLEHRDWRAWDSALTHYCRIMNLNAPSEVIIRQYETLSDDELLDRLSNLKIHDILYTQANNEQSEEAHTITESASDRADIPEGA